MIKFKETFKVEFMNSVIRNFTKEDCQRDLIVLHYILVSDNHVEQYPGTNTTNARLSDISASFVLSSSAICSSSSQPSDSS